MHRGVDQWPPPACTSGEHQGYNVVGVQAKLVDEYSKQLASTLLNGVCMEVLFRTMLKLSMHIFIFL